MKRQKFEQMFFILGTILPFCAILLAFSISGFKIAGEQNIFSDPGKITENIQGLESQIKDDILYKSELTETYGLLHEALALNVIGDMEFIRDDAGLMQRIEPETDTAAFTASVIELADTLQKKQTPLVFMTLPDRGIMFDAADGFVYSGKLNTDMLEQLSQAGIDILDVYEEMQTADDAPELVDFFYYTDFHLTTQAEFYLARLLTDYLSVTHQIEFPATDLVYSETQYEWTDYMLWGNFGRAAGQTFTGTDTFTAFAPLFETNLMLKDFSTNSMREGSFAEVMTNGLSDPTGEKNPYWVTNYGQYPSPYYRYENKYYPDGPDLLLISESMTMRMNTFLTLNAGSVTVLDPRAFWGTEYLAKCLAEYEFDAVIVCGSSTEFYSSSFKSNIEIPETIRSSQGTGYHGMYLDKVNDIAPETVGEIDRQLFEGRETVTLTGWAVDYEAGAPLSALYLQIGDMLLACDYGIKRTSVSDYFQNDNLMMSGFEVSFPAEYLNEDILELRFIQVGADGNYRYEDVVFTITG